MSRSTLERVRGIAGDILEIPAGEFNPDCSTENVANWDSVHHLDLVLALEQEFGLQFEPEEIDQMSSMGQILSILERKLSQSR